MRAHVALLFVRRMWGEIGVGRGRITPVSEANSQLSSSHSVLSLSGPSAHDASTDTDVRNSGQA